jgi:hypothetical protein
MNKLILITIFFIINLSAYSQQTQDSTKIYKKRVLESSEVDILASFYTQDGDNAAVTGGIGTEELSDIAVDITIAIPLNDDDIFSFDGTISSYTSASSGNLNPFSGASSNDDDDDDDDDDDRAKSYNAKSSASTDGGSPWSAASGASKTDTWISANLSYSHSSDNRNTISTAHVSFANEYDYTSFGFGAGLTKLFNKKNTEIGLTANVYLDKWKPEYPTEIHTYVKTNGSLYQDFFYGIDILDSNGNITDKSGVNTWKPINTTLVVDKGRNTYTGSLSFSQILSKNLQISLFADAIVQQGWLSNPMQRVYFKDKANYYIGEASDIPYYTDSNRNDGVFQLADDIERLPDNRLKTPIGMRLHYYINEFLVFKTYYRYYTDDWGINSHTLNVELPIKVSDKVTIYPNYRFYNQTAANYFYNYEEALSTYDFYTSDFDLSKYNSNQYGIGFKYTDVFTKRKIWKLGLKNLSLNYAYYKRNTGLHANIITFGTKFVMQ